MSRVRWLMASSPESIAPTAASVSSRAHIGYGIRPSARRRGLASWALGEMLGEARALGLDRVLIPCLADNIASARTIERNGGVLEGIRDNEHGRKVRRYWIALDR